MGITHVTQHRTGRRDFRGPSSAAPPHSDSDLYWPLGRSLTANFETSWHERYFRIFRGYLIILSLYPHFLFDSHFGVHFVTLDNNAGCSDLLGITEFSR